MEQNTFESQITDLSSKGHGVCRHPDGFVVFVPGTWPGDKVVATITQKKKDFAHATVKNWVHKSSARLDKALCPHHGLTKNDCGGCPWIFADYSAQVEQKTKQLERLKYKLDCSTGQFFESNKNTDYRNRARVHAKDDTLGFFSSNSHSIANVEACITMTETLKTKYTRLRKSHTKQSKLKSYYISEKLDEAIELSPKSLPPFEQANSYMNNLVKKHISEFLEQNKSFNMTELFCGNGNLTECFNKPNQIKLHCYENSQHLLNELKEHIPQAHTFKSDLYQNNTFKKFSKESLLSDTLVLDPPRSGLKNLVELIEKMPHLKKIIYLSCNPMTQIRDIKSLNSKQWKVRFLNGYDFFPNTPHLETLAILETSMP